MKEKRQTVLIVIALMIIGVFLGLTIGEAGMPVYGQATYRTPTPNPEGQIIYTVEEGDSCIRIEILTGVLVADIIAQNDLTEECLLTPGQQLIIGFGEAVDEEPVEPEQDPTPDFPTPTPFAGMGQICIALYEDLDGNQMRATDEFYLAGGVVSVNNRDGTYSETKETLGGDPALVEPVCFEDLDEGSYNISMGIPEGYNPTTSMNYAIDVTAGDTIIIDFGAQPGSQFGNGAAGTPGSGRSPLLLAIGLFLLASGAGLAYFFIRSNLEK